MAKTKPTDDAQDLPPPPAPPDPATLGPEGPPDEAQWPTPLHNPAHPLHHLKDA